MTKAEATHCLDGLASQDFFLAFMSVLNHCGKFGTPPTLRPRII
jgi:hypothetical protein